MKDENEEFVRRNWKGAYFEGGDGCHLELHPGSHWFYGNISCNAWKAAETFVRAEQEKT